MAGQRVSKFWFAVRLDEGRQTTEVFDDFSMSSKLNKVKISIARRFGLPVNQLILVHKGKILFNGNKPISDYGVDCGDTVMLNKRRELSPAVNVPSSTSTNVEDTLTKEELTTQSETEADETTCPECRSADAGKENIWCEDCHNWFHWACLEPPLTELPDGDWFCPDCANDFDIVIRPDNELSSTKQQKGKKRGTSNVRLSRNCGLPSDYRGPVPGISVGQSWQYRSDCHEDGIHRSWMGGIAGSEKTGGAVSICMSGGYDTDKDHGEWFLYTGSGGFAKATSASARTNQKQVKNQPFTRGNLALAATCNALINQNGAEATDWRNSLPIRVVRGGKKKGVYSPSEGYRYDGIYKIVRYYRTQPSANGFYRYIFELRRHDPAPAPWTSQGKKMILELGLKMFLRSSTVDQHSTKAAYSPVRKKISIASKLHSPQKTTTAAKRRRISTAAKPPTHQRALPAANSPVPRRPKGMPSVKEGEVTTAWSIPLSIRVAIAEAISATPSHAKIFDSILSKTFLAKREFITFIQEQIICPICRDFVNYPVTNPCGHLACLNCLKQCLEESEYGCRCTLCSAPLLVSITNGGYGNSPWALELEKKTFLDVVEVDKNLVKVFRLCLKDYCNNIELDESKTSSPSQGRFLGVFDAVVKANNYVKTFASNYCSSSALTDSKTPTYSSDSQEEIDKQLLGDLKRIGHEGSASKNEMGFKQKQALHFNLHWPTLPETKINELREEDHTTKNLKRGYECSTGAQSKETLAVQDAVDGNREARATRRRKLSSQGLQMELSLRMFTTFDEDN